MKTLLGLLISLLLISSALFSSELTPTKDEVAKLYVATFNRAPDSAGLEYWVNDSGLTLSQIAQSFFDQSETQTLYPPTVSNREFIESVYQNLFNREPDSAGWDYWEEQLNTGAFTKNRFIEAVINGALGDDAVILSNKTEVGLSFADAGLSDVTLAKDIMLNVTSTIQSVISTKEEINEIILSSDKGDVSLDSMRVKLSLLKTGDTISYVKGDDGYYKKGLIRNYATEDGIVTDYTTGLMWQDNIDVNTTRRTWEDSRDYCENLTLGDYDDWRMPTYEELRTIVDFGKAQPAIDSAFTYTSSVLFYWTSTLFVDNSTQRWTIGFYYGSSMFTSTSFNEYVRCVRENK